MNNQRKPKEEKKIQSISQESTPWQNILFKSRGSQTFVNYIPFQIIQKSSQLNHIKDQKMWKKNYWALLGFQHIEHNERLAKHLCLPLWIQIYFSQGHICPPHTLKLLMGSLPHCL